MMNFGGKSSETRLVRPLLCNKSQRQVTNVCTTKGCQSHPLMCGDDECSCQSPHEEHISSSKLKGILQKIEKTPTMPEEVKNAKILVSRWFKEITKRVNEE